ncbi:hypothetical protein CFP56_022457 [Quercus suber]|uniref:Uncharacterized protein n=1 Tax=Quercus suber TaxID=58331 RepID=A0AAW0KD65_QUESU
MHNPIGFLSSWSFSSIENQSLLDPNRLRIPDRLISASSLPVPSSGRPIRPRTVRVLPVSRRKEVPLFLSIQSLTLHDKLFISRMKPEPRSIENQSLLDPNRLRIPDRLISASSLPVPSSGRPIRPRTVRVLPVSRRKEVPLFLSIQSLTCKFKSYNHINKQI